MTTRIIYTVLFIMLSWPAFADQRAGIQAEMRTLQQDRQNLAAEYQEQQGQLQQLDPNANPQEMRQSGDVSSRAGIQAEMRALQQDRQKLDEENSTQEQAVAGQLSSMSITAKQEEQIRQQVLKEQTTSNITINPSSSATLPNPDDSILTGDVRYACEATLCLASGKRPHECTPSLKRYFDITRRHWSDTKKARKNFLKLCPSGSYSGQDAFLTALVNGSGRCDASTFNRQGTTKRLQMKVPVTECSIDTRWDMSDATVKQYEECNRNQWNHRFLNRRNRNQKVVTHEHVAKRFTGLNGHTVTVTCQHITVFDSCDCIAEEYLLKEYKYFAVNGNMPSECAALWNNQYTYYEASDRPHLVYGDDDKPWDTRWVD